MSSKHVLTYWPIKAKNIASALALEQAGMEWELGAGPGSKGTGNLWAEWLEMKPNTVWGYLPNLEVPGGRTIGNELAILQYIARKNPAMGGESDVDFNASQELLHQAEELYQKLTKCVPTILAKDKSPEEYNKFWTGSDPNTHSNAQGLLVYLAQFESYMEKCGAGSDKYTTTGMTIGEIKLYATLAIVQLVDATVPFPPKVSAFMARFNADAKVKVVMDEKVSSCKQYFIQPPAEGEGTEKRSSCVLS